MRNKTIIHAAVGALTVLGAAFSAGAEEAFPDESYAATVLRGYTDKANPVGYRNDETVVFRLYAEKIPRGAESRCYTISWERTGDDGVKAKGSAPYVVGCDFAVTTKFEIARSPVCKGQRGGFVRLFARLCDETGRPIEPKHRNYVEFDGGAGAEIATLAPGDKEPADFDRFWAAQKRKLAKVPLAPELKELPCRDSQVRLYAVRIPCAGPASYPARPVTGYLTIPVAASKDNPMPAQGMFQGYGCYKPNPPAWGIPHDCIRFEINAHGFELGRDDNYYTEFFKTIQPAGYGYGMSPEENKNPETNYFNGMVLRVLRCYDFLKTLPEWNGKDLWAQGGSQGGLQAMWAAGLVDGITKVDTWITWFCDQGGELVGRQKSAWHVPFVQQLGYYDAVNFAKRAPKSLTIDISRAGLGDYSCSPPSGVAVLYNAIRGPKSIRWVQGSTHGYEPPVPRQEITLIAR